MYTPRPIDTSTVRLSPDLLALTERLAENTHDIWARQKIGDGWRHGPTDAAAKTHASLVPYSQLPESEKQYDRATAMETIKALLALGYGVRKQE
ncbi:MAG TPA: RyR domain-containing protein [Phycisphaerae bacterium]|nr:RyR domain-containing protein [Phycisphaerae bacterium]